LLVIPQKSASAVEIRFRICPALAFLSVIPAGNLLLLWTSPSGLHHSPSPVRRCHFWPLPVPAVARFSLSS
jgi:hypothetical protein